MEREHKTFAVHATKVVEGEQGVVEHYVAVMGNIDLAGDVIHPGAFAKSIMERGLKVKVLDGHNAGSVRNIVGRPLALREVGRLELPEALLQQYPDATGALWAKTQFLLDTPEGRGVFDRIKSGAADEYSIGYDPIVTDYATLETPDGKKTVRNLREVRLWEYSPVVFAANPATTTLSSKDATPAESKPSPGNYDSEDAFMADCVPMREGEGNEHEQAVAACLDIWRNRKGGEEMPDDDEDEDDDKRRRRRMPAAGCTVTPVVRGSADDPAEQKAGRRLRRERIEQAKRLIAELNEFVTWAEYSDQAAEDEAATAPDNTRAADSDSDHKQAAGPDIPPTADRMAVVESLKKQLRIMEVEL